MKLQELIERATQKEKLTVALAKAEDQEVLKSVSLSLERSIAKFILVGNEQKINELLQLHYPELLEHEDIFIEDARSDKEAAERAVKKVSSNEAQVLMKGHIATSILLKAVLNKEFGLRTGSALSHVAAFELDGYDRLLFVTDAAMNISPDLTQKMDIIQNAVKLAQSTGVQFPKVAVLSAVEVVNPSMPSSVDAAILSQMNQRGQISGCLIDGPLALDIAVSKEAAKHKGMKGNVAGEADILVVPNIETGNVLYKSFVYFAHARVGGMITGAKAPIVLTSRSDCADTKLYSLALALTSTVK